MLSTLVVGSGWSLRCIMAASYCHSWWLMLVWYFVMAIIRFWPYSFLSCILWFYLLEVTQQLPGILNFSLQFNRYVSVDGHSTFKCLTLQFIPMSHFYSTLLFWVSFLRQFAVLRCLQVWWEIFLILIIRSSHNYLFWLTQISSVEGTWYFAKIDVCSVSENGSK